MFSVTAEYALRAMIYLALHTDKPAPGRVIAESTDSPSRYLSRVLRDLTTAGLLRAYRGPTGGFELARDASEISVLDVVNVVDPIRRIERCPLNIESHGKNLCRLHQRLDESIAVLEHVLAESRITDLLVPSASGSMPLTPTSSCVLAKPEEPCGNSEEEKVLLDDCSGKVGRDIAKSGGEVTGR